MQVLIQSFRPDIFPLQMLSMRNGVYLNPSYLSGALEPVQASQMFAALGVSGRNVAAPSSGAVAPPVNQSSGAHHSFDPMNSPQQNQPRPLVLPSCPKTTIPEPPFHLEPSQSHLQSFQLPESSEVTEHKTDQCLTFDAYGVEVS